MPSATCAAASGSVPATTTHERASSWAPMRSPSLSHAAAMRSGTGVLTLRRAGIHPERTARGSCDALGLFAGGEGADHDPIDRHAFAARRHDARRDAGDLDAARDVA